MDPLVVEILHDLLVSPKNVTTYPSKTIEYTPELYNDICEDFGDYMMMGYTVRGAQDPAFIYLGEGFGKKYPELAEFRYVRVIDRFLNSWNSETLLEFSNEDMTDAEYEQYEEVMRQEEEGDDN